MDTRQQHNAVVSPDEWYTPRWMIERLGPFDCDPCAAHADVRPFETAKTCWTKEDDGLSKEWQGTVWMNPPYSRVLLRQFCEKMARHGNGFAVFDAKVDDLYLLCSSRNEIAAKLGAPVVPFMGEMTLDEAIALVRTGFKSKIAENRDFIAEGLVIRTEIGLRNRRGERIITKIKHCDFEKYKSVYGTLDPVEQHVNSHIKED